MTQTSLHGWAIDETTKIVGRDNLSKEDFLLVERANLWAELFNTNPHRFADDLYTKNIQAWQPVHGLWLRGHDNFKRFETEMAAAWDEKAGVEPINQGGKRVHFRTVLAKDNLLVVEEDSIGYLALLFFDSDRNIYLDRTYAIFPLEGFTPSTQKGPCAHFASLGSLPPFDPEIFGGYSASRQEVLEESYQIKARATHIAGEAGLTAQEQTNLQAIWRWNALHKERPGEMYPNAYTPNAEISLVMAGRESIRLGSQAALSDLADGLKDIFPNMSTKLTTIIPRDDHVVVEAVTCFVGDIHEWWATILQFKNGKIIRERKYDMTTFHHSSPLAPLAQAANWPCAEH